MGSKSHHNIPKKSKKSKKSKKKNKSYDIQDIKKIFNDKCSKYNVPYVPAIMRKVDKIIVFGDIHGDYETAIEMLNAAKLIKYNDQDKDYEWMGGNTYVVQVGDQIDRCRPEFHHLHKPNGMKCSNPNATENDEHSDIKILELFTKLDLEARKVGGMVISLLGNHELLNASGYMNYVSHAGLEGFNNYKDPKEPDKTFENGTEARIHAFKPGNEYATLLGCTRYPAVVIGSNIFVHAGIIDGLLEDLKITGPSDIEQINIKLRLWLLGVIDKSNISHIIDSADCNSMFWTRVLGKIKPGVPLDSAVCQKNLSKVLDIFHVHDGGKLRMMIGHTPQSFMYSDDINSTCGNRIWRVDNGSSKAFDSFDTEYSNNKKRSISRRTQYLMILNDNEYHVCDSEKCNEEKVN
jgi:hypothetical protein